MYRIMLPEHSGHHTGTLHSNHMKLLLPEDTSLGVVFTALNAPATPWVHPWCGTIPTYSITISSFFPDTQSSTLVSTVLGTWLILDVCMDGQTDENMHTWVQTWVMQRQSHQGEECCMEPDTQMQE